MKKYWLAALGLLLIIAGVVSSIFTSNNSEVPNDPNIGGGILFILGIALLIAGIFSARARRSD